MIIRNSAAEGTEKNIFNLIIRRTSVKIGGLKIME